jgi:hypothetical protein
VLLPWDARVAAARGEATGARGNAPSVVPSPAKVSRAPQPQSSAPPDVRKNGVTVYGGFAGFETSVRNATPAPTRRSSPATSPATTARIFTDNSFHVLSGAGTNATAVLDGFTVRAAMPTARGTRTAAAASCASRARARRSATASSRPTAARSAAARATSTAPARPSRTATSTRTSAGPSAAPSTWRPTWARPSSAACSPTTPPRAPARSRSSARARSRSTTRCSSRTRPRAGGGGAIFIAGSSGQIRNCTVVGNWRPPTRRRDPLASGGTPSIVNCVIHGNTVRAAPRVSRRRSRRGVLAVTYSPGRGLRGHGQRQ